MPGQIAFEIVFGIDGPSVGSRSVVFEVFAEDVSISVGAVAGRLRSRGVIAMEPFTNFLTELPLASRRIWSLADGPSWRLEITLIDAGVAWRFVIAGVPATASTSGVGGAADSARQWRLLTEQEMKFS